MPIVDNELISEIYDEEPAEVPFVPLDQVITDTLKSNLIAKGDGTWMTDLTTGKSMKYSELLANIEKVSVALRRRGLKTNDVMLIMASNHIEIPLLFFATWKAGGSIACLTLNLLPEDIKARALEVGAKFVLTDAMRAARVLEAVKSVDSVLEVFVTSQFDGCTPFQRLLQEPIDGIPEPVGQIDPDSLAWLMYSSGTTGVSKGIVQTHRTLSRYYSQSRNLQMLGGRKLLFINYMINSGGMNLAVGTTLSAAEIYCLSDFSDDKLLPAIDQTKPLAVTIFPSQMAHICRHAQLEQFDLSSVFILMTGGSIINPNFERQIFDIIPNLRLLLVFYGMSETFLLAGNNPRPGQSAVMDKPAAVARHIVGSVGKLFPQTKLKVLDDVTGEKLGPNQIGEICVKPQWKMKEYLNRPDETAKTIVDGWVHTGDQGYYDQDENVYVIGRYKELIKFRMAHVVPSNIERHLMTHPAVEDAAVVGQPHDVHGELPVAFVVVRAGHSVTGDELIRYIDERVVDEERLRGGVRFTGKIPRNDLGKIVRHQLVKMLPDDPERPVSRM